LTRALVSIVYFYAGVAKMNEDWIRGEPLAHWMPRRAKHYPVLAPILTSYWNALAMSWAGLLIDTFLPFMFMVQRLRPLAFLLSFSFHSLNKLFFNIGVFPFVMACVTTIFFQPDWPRAVWRAVTRQAGAARADVVHFDRGAPLSAAQWRVLGTLGLFLLWQVAMPLRHHFCCGQVEWNEVGHRFSWRMKLRDKLGQTHFFVRPNASAAELQLVNVSKWLTSTQADDLIGQPDTIVQFARHLADELERELKQRPAVHVLSVCRLNFRTSQLFIDPTADLGALAARSWVCDVVLPLVPRGVEAHALFFNKTRTTSNAGRIKAKYDEAVAVVSAFRASESKQR